MRMPTLSTGVLILGWTLLASASVSLSAHAQELAGAVAPPSAPWVAPVPAAARWRIAVTPTTPPAAAEEGTTPAPVLKEIRVAKTAPIKHDFLVYSDWSTEESWYLDKVVFLPETFSKTTIYMTDFAPGNIGGLGDPVHALGYTGFDWIGSKSYEGVVTYQDVSCYHYKLDGDSPAEAWVRVPDKLPVAYRMHGFLYVYSFVAPPEEALGLPPPYEAVRAANAQRKKQQALFSQDLGKH